MEGEAERTVEPGKGPLNADWELITRYRAAIPLITPTMAEGDESPEVLGNPEGLIGGLLGRTRTAPEYAQGVRAHIAHVTEVLRSGGRVTGVEVHLGGRRHIDYTILEERNGTEEHVGVEYKHWTGTLTTLRRNQLATRLEEQLNDYVERAADAGLDRIRITWPEFSNLDPTSQRRFRRIIANARSRARNRGLAFTQDLS